MPSAFFFPLSSWKITAGIKRISGVIKLSSLSGGAAAKWEGFFWQVVIVVIEFLSGSKRAKYLLSVTEQSKGSSDVQYVTISGKAPLIIIKRDEIMLL